MRELSRALPGWKPGPALREVEGVWQEEDGPEGSGPADDPVKTSNPPATLRHSRGRACEEIKDPQLHFAIPARECVKNRKAPLLFVIPAKERAKKFGAITSNGGGAEESEKKRPITRRQYFVIPAKERVKKLRDSRK